MRAFYIQGHRFFYRFLRSALVADYFTWDILALSIIRSPTTRPYLRRYNFSRYNSAGVDTRHFGDYWFRKSPSLQIMVSLGYSAQKGFAVSLVYPHQNGFTSRLHSRQGRIVQSPLTGLRLLQIVLIGDILALSITRSPTSHPRVANRLGHHRSQYRSHIPCKKASLRTTSSLQIILQGIHSLPPSQGRDIF